MRTLIVAFAVVGCCLAVPQTFEKSIDYEIPSGRVSFSSHAPTDSVHGVYAQSYGGLVEPTFKYGQTGVKSVYGGYVQPAVKYGQTFQAQPAQGQVYGVHSGYGQSYGVNSGYGQSYGVQPAYSKSYVKSAFGGVAQPSNGYEFPSKVVKPVVPFVQHAAPVNKYVPATRIAQPVTPFVQPAASFVQPAASYVQPSASFVHPSASFVHPAASFVHPAASFVHPAASFVQPEIRYSQPIAHQTPYVQTVKPVARFGNVASPAVHSYAKYTPAHQAASRIGQVGSFVQPAVRYNQELTPVAPAVTKYGQVGSFVQPAVRYGQQITPVAKYGQVAPAFRHHEVLTKTAEAPAAIIALNQDASADGTFVSNFQTENGIQSTVSGSVKAVAGSEEPAQVMSGSYSYTSPDGTPVLTTWYADENGFHADGDHIPAVPEEIQRSVDYLRSLPPSHEDLKYGNY